MKKSLSIAKKKFKEIDLTIICSFIINFTCLEF